MRVIIPLALSLLAPVVGADTAPPPPQVTMGADIKLLRFDWEAVPGAEYYQVYIRPGGTRFIAIGERLSAGTTHAAVPIPVHLQNWPNTRYRVAACNTSGCTNSALLNPRPLMLETIGYLKASNTDALDSFGQSVVLSDDGYTLAVSAGGEASNASGVNGNQADNSSPTSGAVYVFRRRGNAWHQEAYLKAPVNQPDAFFGIDLFHAWRGAAFNADGSILAVAAPHEDVGTIHDAGALHIYQRTRNVWRWVTTLHAPQPQPEDQFGMTTDLSDDGNTLKVNSRLPATDRGVPQFRTHIYLRSGNLWQHSVTLAPFYAGDDCASTRLSGDGQTLVSSCVTPATQVARIVTRKRVGDTWVHASDLPAGAYPTREPIALNRDATVMAITDGFASFGVGLYRWIGGNWVREASFPAPASKPPTPPSWGWELALANGGDLLAIGDPFAFEAGPGVSPISTPATVELGAVFLYQRDARTNTWSLRNVVKSANPGFRDYFGSSISLSASGRTLAVGAPGENSDATGIDGQRANENARDAGAAYLY